MHNLISDPGGSSYKQKASKSLIHAVGMMKRYQEAILADFGINLSKLNILQVLYDEFPATLSQNQIKDTITDKTIDLSRVIKQLDEMSIIKNMRHNKRLSEITITPKGIELLGEISKYREEIDYGLSGISEEEAKQVLHLMQKITETLVSPPRRTA